MTLAEHMSESISLFGEPFEVVNRWLDEFAGTPEFGMHHRRKRHHLRGIEEVRAKWGDRASEAARAHIISDLEQEGWTETDRFPRDEAEYVKMGLY